ALTGPARAAEYWLTEETQATLWLTELVELARWAVGTLVTTLSATCSSATASEPNQRLLNAFRAVASTRNRLCGWLVSLSAMPVERGGCVVLGVYQHRIDCCFRFQTPPCGTLLHARPQRRNP